jgi:hypothetical protein
VLPARPANYYRCSFICMMHDAYDWCTDKTPKHATGWRSTMHGEVAKLQLCIKPCGFRSLAQSTHAKIDT